MHRLATLAPRLLLALALGLAAGCGGDDAPAPVTDTASDAHADAKTDTAVTPDGGQVLPDVSQDVAVVDAGKDASTTPDVVTVDVGGGDADVVVGPPPEEGDPVVIDLEPYLGDGTGTGVYARQIESEADLIGGEAATGQVGDYLIGNDEARFVIQGPSRAIAVCPYGGGLIDGDITRGAGEPGHDGIGAVCDFFNVGRTMNAESVEILRDGSDGGAAVIAVTGRDEVLDFINLQGAMEQVLPGLPLDLAVSPDVDLPVTMTAYYIVRPGEPGVRMVTAIRNDGEGTYPIVFGQLIDSGGAVEFFNPASALKGFGYGGFSPEKMDFLAFKGEQNTHVYAPPRLPGKKAGTTREGAGYLVISGVAGIILGTDDALGAILDGGPDAPTHEARKDLAPGAVTVAERWIAVGDGSISSVTDFLYGVRDQETGDVSGQALDDNGDPVAGARISAVDEKGAAVTQFVSRSDGTFGGKLPAGTFTLSALAAGRAQVGEPQVVVEAGKLAEPEVKFTLRGTLSVHITDVDAKPIPGKVTVRCDGPCAVVPTEQQRDISYDFNFKGAIEPIGPTGAAEIPLPPGNYRVVVSRGPEYGLWPADYDASTNPGEAITIEGGKKVELSPVLARAIDSTGWLAADFHVHAVNSPDAPVKNTDRIRSFVAEAVDVIVATDHDFVTDYAPVVNDLGAQNLIAPVTGVELTTFDYGHYNSFPIVRDPTSRNGGAIDWAGGPGYGLSPKTIFEELHKFPGDQVIQVNHPNSGYFFLTKLDALSGMTFADPAKFRLEPKEPDPVTGDTGLWDESFTAVELYNGYGYDKLYQNMHWWLTFLNRGFSPTGTAVSDTHRLITDPGGGPRSYVRMPDGKDGINPFAQGELVTAINAGRVIGSSGPLIDVHLVDDASQAKAGLGETLSLSAAGTPIRLEVRIQTPSWYKVDHIDVFSNTVDAATEPGELNASKPTVATSLDFELEDGDLAPAFQGGAVGGRYDKTLSIDLTPEADAYYVVLVTATQAASGDLRPVTYGAEKPMAFSNPVFVDADGDGYKPPIDPLTIVPPLPPKPLPLAQSRPATREDLLNALEQAKQHSCHAGHGMKHEP